MRCSKDGCDWEGELRDLERHLCNLCLYVEEVCPLGCGQSYPHHLLQTHQLDECPQQPLEAKLETLRRQLQQQLIHQKKKHDRDKKELQQQLAQQEKKQEEDKEELQQQLAQEKLLIQQLTGIMMHSPCTQWVVLDHVMCLACWYTFIP